MPANTEVVNLIDQFIAHVSEYLVYDQLCKIAEATVERTDVFGKAATGREWAEAQHRMHVAASPIRRDGPRLAEALEKHGINSRNVLAIVHCASGGGGADALRPRWRRWKVQLQRTALRLGIDGGAGEVGGQGGENESAAVKPGTKTPTATGIEDHNDTDAQARALGVLAAHPDWTVSAVAKATGVSRTTLYTWPKFRTARAVIQDAGRDHRTARSVTRGKPHRRRTTPDTLDDTQDDTSAEFS